MCYYTYKTYMSVNTTRTLNTSKNLKLKICPSISVVYMESTLHTIWILLVITNNCPFLFLYYVHGGNAVTYKIWERFNLCNQRNRWTELCSVGSVRHWFMHTNMRWYFKISVRLQQHFFDFSTAMQLRTLYRYSGSKSFCLIPVFIL